MKVCINCFADLEIRGIIKAINFKGDCEICSTVNEFVYDTNKHTDLKTPFNKLLERYTVKSKLDVNYPSGLTVSIKSELKNNWNIFNDLEESQIYDILIEVCKEKYNESPEIFDGLVGIAELGNNEYLERNTLFFSESWKEFAEEIKYKTRFHSEKFNTDIFLNYLDLLSEPIHKGTIMYRGRRSGHTGLPKEDMGSVPRDKTRAGRANPKGIPYLYLATDIKTVLYELLAVKMSYVTIAEFELIDKGQIIDLTKIDQISPFVFENEEMLTQHIVNRKYLREIHNEIVKPTSQNESYLDYLPTQYVFDFIRKNKNILLETKYSRDEKDREIIGVKYRSSLNPSGMNYVFFEDKFFDVKTTTVYKINNVEYQKTKVN